MAPFVPAIGSVLGWADGPSGQAGGRRGERLALDPGSALRLRRPWSGEPKSPIPALPFARNLLYAPLPSHPAGG